MTALALLLDLRRWVSAAVPQFEVMGKDPRTKAGEFAARGLELVRRVDGLVIDPSGNDGDAEQVS